MRVALANPPWSFETSVHLGRRAPRLPLEPGRTKALLEAAGHEAPMLSGRLCGTPADALADAEAGCCR